MIPDESLGKCRETGFMERRVGINAATLASLIAEHTLSGCPDANGLGIAVVSGNKNIEAE